MQRPVGRRARTHMYHIRRVACVLPISKCETFEVGRVHFLHCAAEKKTCVHTPATSNNNSHIRCGGVRSRRQNLCPTIAHVPSATAHTHTDTCASCYMHYAPWHSNCGDAPAPAPADTTFPSQPVHAHVHTRIDKPNFLPHLERRRRAREVSRCRCRRCRCMRRNHA